MAERKFDVLVCGGFCSFHVLNGNHWSSSYSGSGAREGGPSCRALVFGITLFFVLPMVCFSSFFLLV